ncbi:MAG: outer membrane lipoprotein carrier protein LolA [Pseudomonadota bacterium]
MHRRSFLAALTAAVAVAEPASAKISLADLSRYLNGLKTVRGAFTQINADGTLTTGLLYLNRPGRMRFEYDPPDRSLVMAGGGQVAIFDPKSNTPPEQFPLRRTPLNIILQRNVDLGRTDMVVAHRDNGNTTSIVAQDPEHPEYGNIELVFSANPIQLRQWIVTGQGGDQVTVILGEVTEGMRLSASLFDIVQEVNRRFGD